MPLLYRFGSSFNAILPSSRTIGVLATFFANFKILLPIPRPFDGDVYHDVQLCLRGRLRRMCAGKWLCVTCSYLATKVLPFGRVTLLGVSLFIIIILSLLAIFLLISYIVY